MVKESALTERQALALLKKYAPGSSEYQKRVQHGKAVQRAALTIAKAIKKNHHKVDLNFIKTASLLHDIGYFFVEERYFPAALRHAPLGAQILRKEKLPRHARVAEVHLGIGKTKQEIVAYSLPLPRKDLIPKSVEEKIITFAANSVFNDRLASPDEVAKKFKKWLPAKFSDLERFTAEMERLMGVPNEP